LCTLRNHDCSEKNLSLGFPIPQLRPNCLNMIRTICPPEVLLSPLSYELYANNGGVFLRLSFCMSRAVMQKKNISYKRV
jgi:hypothetical protein